MEKRGEFPDTSCPGQSPLPQGGFLKELRGWGSVCETEVGAVFLSAVKDSFELLSSHGDWDTDCADIEKVYGLETGEMAQ